MRLPWLLAVSFLASVCAAQSVQPALPDKQLTPAQPAKKTTIAAPILALNDAGVAAKGKTKVRVFPLGSPLYVEGRNLAQDDWACFSIEAYRFSRDNPESDATRLVDHSTCQGAAQFQLKAAIDQPR